jgi:hypothetical protein
MTFLDYDQEEDGRLVRPPNMVIFFPLMAMQSTLFTAYIRNCRDNRLRLCKSTRSIQIEVAELRPTSITRGPFQFSFGFRADPWHRSLASLELGGPQSKPLLRAIAFGAVQLDRSR